MYLYIIRSHSLSQGLPGVYVLCHLHSYRFGDLLSFSYVFTGSICLAPIHHSPMVQLFIFTIVYCFSSISSVNV